MRKLKKHTKKKLKNPTYQEGGVSTEGYKKNSPDVNNPYNIIPSGKITMKDVQFPVQGTDNLGNVQMMYPGQEYQFPGSYVTEVPMKELGGPSLEKAREILHDGTIRGKKITEKQRKYFGWLSNQKQSGGTSADSLALWKKYNEGDYHKWLQENSRSMDIHDSLYGQYPNEFKVSKGDKSKIIMPKDFQKELPADIYKNLQSYPVQPIYYRRPYRTTDVDVSDAERQKGKQKADSTAQSQETTLGKVMSGVDAVMSAPQKAATWAVTGKYQTPAEGMGVDPMSAEGFAINMGLDPMNLVGAGLLGKGAKVASRLTKAGKVAEATKTADYAANTAKYADYLKDFSSTTRDYLKANPAKYAEYINKIDPELLKNLSNSPGALQKYFNIQTALKVPGMPAKLLSTDSKKTVRNMGNFYDEISQAKFDEYGNTYTQSGYYPVFKKPVTTTQDTPKTLKRTVQDLPSLTESTPITKEATVPETRQLKSIEKPKDKYLFEPNTVNLSGQRGQYVYYDSDGKAHVISKETYDQNIKQSGGPHSETTQMFNPKIDYAKRDLDMKLAEQNSLRSKQQYLRPDPNISDTQKKKQQEYTDLVQKKLNPNWNPVNSLLNLPGNILSLASDFQPMSDEDKMRTAGNHEESMNFALDKAIGFAMNEAMGYGLVKGIPNIYNLNPLANKLNDPNKFYRMFNETGYNDLKSSGVMRSSPTGTPDNFMGTLNIGNRTTSFPSFSKGKPDINYLPKEGPGYIAEYSGDMFKRGDINPVTNLPIKGRHWAYRAIEQNTGNTLKRLPVEDLTIYDANPHWLKGYQEVSKGTGTYNNQVYFTNKMLNYKPIPKERPFIDPNLNQSDFGTMLPGTEFNYGGTNMKKFNKMGGPASYGDHESTLPQMMFNVGGTPCYDCGGAHMKEGGQDFTQDKNYSIDQKNDFLGWLKSTSMKKLNEDLDSEHNQFVQDFSNQHMMPDGSMMDNGMMKKGGGFKLNPAHKGWCTPLSNPKCTGKRRQFAINAKNHFKKQEFGGSVDDMYQYGNPVNSTTAPINSQYLDPIYYPYGNTNQGTNQATYPPTDFSNLAPDPTNMNMNIDDSGTEIPYVDTRPNFQNDQGIYWNQGDRNKPMGSQTQNQLAQSLKPKKKQYNNEALVAWGLAGMEGLTNLLNMDERKNRENWLKNKTHADQVFATTPAGTSGSRGDYSVNEGYFRPDDMTPTQFQGAAGFRKNGGASYKKNEEVYLSDKAAADLIAAGYEIEEID